MKIFTTALEYLDEYAYYYHDLVNGYLIEVEYFAVNPKGSLPHYSWTSQELKTAKNLAQVYSKNENINTYRINNDIIIEAVKNQELYEQV